MNPHVYRTWILMVQNIWVEGVDTFRDPDTGEAKKKRDWTRKFGNTGEVVAEKFRQALKVCSISNTLKITEHKNVLIQFMFSYLRSFFCF